MFIHVSINSVFSIDINHRRYALTPSPTLHIYKYIHKYMCKFSHMNM